MYTFYFLVCRTFGDGVYVTKSKEAKERNRHQRNFSHNINWDPGCPSEAWRNAWSSFLYFFGSIFRFLPIPFPSLVYRLIAHLFSISKCLPVRWGWWKKSLHIFCSTRLRLTSSRGVLTMAMTRDVTILNQTQLGTRLILFELKLN